MTEKRAVTQDDASAIEPPPDSVIGRRMVILRLAAAVFAIGLIAAALVLLHGRGGRSPSGGAGALDTQAPVVNQPAPNFALPDMNGRLVKLSDLRGQVVLVNFWATWCIPCRQELPAIQEVYQEQRGQGFTVLEVNEQEPPATVSGFAREMGELPPIVLDRDGSVMQQYKLKGLPDSFVIDRQGNVRALSYGPVSRGTILKYIDLARQAAP
jgi:cytochrome c biogenesis protein CcmG/thiol:disulfide interchange protein DsbE